MFTFIKKLLGLDKETMKEAGVQIEQVPYKVEQPIPAGDVAPQPVVVEGAGVVVVPVNPQCSDSVTQPDGNECKTPAPIVAVETQITDAVTQASPAKPQRKPRTAKAAPPAKEKAAPKKAAAITAKKPGRKSKV